MDTKEKAAEIMNAATLDELCDLLNEDVAAQDEYVEDYGQAGRNSDAIQQVLTDLPIFGATSPADTMEIYSWDDARVLRWCPSSEQLDVDGRRIGPSEWYLEPRGEDA